ncbi:taste receptor type 2 member 40-like [Pleurodeles waltl]|uniref:taste receptor type 2 member 40-like n=1 Tax=Pleurodeles waltl TaxID=8319 RepID=UPI0037098582
MDPLDIFFIVFLGFALLMGIATNTFIAAVIAVPIIRSRRLPSSSDLLLLGVAVTNIPLQCSLSGNNMLRFLWEEMYNRDNVWKSFFILFPIFGFSNFWINTWLCVFYCIKIVNFSHPFISRIRLRMAAMIPWLLLGSVLVSLVINLPEFWHCTKLYTINSTTTNTTFEGTVRDYSIFQKCIIIIMGCFLPLVVIITSSVLILTSLYQHTQQMQKNMTSSGGGHSLEALNKAAKTTLALLILYIMFDLSFLVVSLSRNGDAKTFRLYFSVCGCSVYPFIDSLILIFGNTKLKAAAVKTLCFHEH